MKFLLGLILSGFLCVSTIEAQPPVVSPTPPGAVEDRGLTDPELMALDVSVWSSKAGYLRDLTHKDFEVYVENVRHEIKFFSQKSEPASVAVLFDLSGSMKGRRSGVSEVSAAAEGFKSFLEASHPESQYDLLTFGKEVKVVRETTSDRESLRQALDEIKKTDPKDDQTLLYDAIQAGFERVLKGKHRRKILFLFTDALNNGSKEKFEEIKKLSKKENVTVYFVKVTTEDNSAGLEQFISFRTIPVLKREFADLNLVADSATTYYANNSNLLAMNELVTQTGGRFFYPTDASEAAEVFRDIAEEAKSQYIVGIDPKTSSRKDWNRIKIKLNLSKEKLSKLGKISVRTKAGYYPGKS